MPAPYQTIVFKSADETRNNIGEPSPSTPVLIVDPDLQAVVPTGYYDFRIMIHAHTTTGNFATRWRGEVRFTGTFASCFSEYLTRRFHDAGTDSTVEPRVAVNFDNTVTPRLTNVEQINHNGGGTNARGVYYLQGLMVVDNPGTLAVYWMKESNTAGSGGLVTTKKDSYIYLRKLC